MMLQTAHPGGGAFWGVPRNLVFAIDQWAVICTILGFGSLYLRQRDSRVLRYLGDAVFTCYLAHQTILVVAVWLIGPLGWAAPLEAGALVIEAPWSRATPGGAKVAGGFLRITNTGTAPERLTGGTFARAGVPPSAPAASASRCRIPFSIPAKAPLTMKRM
jgi:hypothetical protein